MGDCFQSRQAQKAARPFDGVKKTENVVENGPVFRIVLETHQFGIDDVQALRRFRQEFTDEIVHSMPRIR